MGIRIKHKVPEVALWAQEGIHKKNIHGNNQVVRI
jgi:hypothetical protein